MVFLSMKMYSKACSSFLLGLRYKSFWTVCNEHVIQENYSFLNIGFLIQFCNLLNMVSIMERTEIIISQRHKCFSCWDLENFEQLGINGIDDKVINSSFTYSLTHWTCLLTTWNDFVERTPFYKVKLRWPFTIWVWNTVFINI